MARKKNASSAGEELATTDGNAALALPDHDELAGVLGDDDLVTDGLEETDAEDIQIAAKVFNFKGVDEDGDPIPANAFYDTVDESVSKSIEGTLLTVHKTNEWREYDEAEGASKVRCRSFDRVTGTMEDGTQRPCAGCPDAQWQMRDGKRTRRCGPVYNVVGVEALTQKAFIIRCKRTSLRPFKQYLNRHFLGRRVVKGKRMNYPLFAFDTSISLKMSDDRKYAIPVFERGDVRTADQIKASAEEAKFYREAVMPVLAKVSDSDRDADGERSSQDTPTRPEDFSDDAAAPSQPGAW